MAGKAVAVAQGRPRRMGWREIQTRCAGCGHPWIQHSRMAGCLCRDSWGRPCACEKFKVKNADR